jgi:hypothetical protein
MRAQEGEQAVGEILGGQVFFVAQDFFAVAVKKHHGRRLVYTQRPGEFLFADFRSGQSV